MSSFNAYLTLFFYTALMFTLPFVSFYGTKHYLTTHYKLTDFECNCISVTAAVITVNLIIASFVYKALNEPDDPKESQDSVDSNQQEINTHNKDD